MADRKAQRNTAGNIDAGIEATVLQGIFEGPVSIVHHRQDKQATMKVAARNALFLTNPEHDRASLVSEKGDRVEGTCDWIENDAMYISWLTGETQLLWIKGGPAKGKTMISIFLTGALEKQTEANTVFYFCTSNNPQRNHDIAVLRGLIWHLTEKCTHLEDHLVQHLDSEKKTKYTLENREALWAIFANILKDPRVGKTFCLIDGLDELDESSQEWLLPKLVSLEKTAFRNKIKLIMLSQPLLGLHGVPSLDLDLLDDSRRDVQTFLTTGVDELAKRLQHRGFTPALRKEVTQTLLDLSENTFLYIGFAMVELRKKKTPTQVRKTLGDLPQGLRGYYQRMLQQIDPQFKSTAIHILRWVLMAIEPLTLEELSDAVQIEASESIDATQAMRDQIVECGPLLAIQNNRVILVHQSAKEYLTGSAVSEEFRMEAGEAHNILALDCIACIGRSRMQVYPPTRLFTSSWEVLNRAGSVADPLSRVWFEEAYPGESPLLRYAIYRWPEHAKLATSLADCFANGLFTEPRLRKAWWQVYSQKEGVYPVPPWCGDCEDLHIASYLGIEPWIQSLLATVDVNREDRGGRTPLYMAAAVGSEIGVKMLLATGKVDVNAKDWTGSTSLHAAARAGHKEVLTSLLADCKVDVNASDRSGTTPLHLVAQNGRIAIAKVLLATNKVDVNLRNAQGATPLLIAATMGCKEVVKILVANDKIHVNLQDLRGNTPLAKAVLRNSVSSVRTLLASGKVDFDCRDIEGRTPLYTAVQYGREAVVEQLLETNRFVVDLKAGMYGLTPLYWAVYNQNPRIEALLLAAGAKEEELGSTRPVRDVPISHTRRFPDSGPVTDMDHILQHEYG